MRPNRSTPNFVNVGKMHDPTKILISRTDAIGDVCLTLPVCQALAAAYPKAELTYLCRNYTRAVVACFEPIDQVLVLDELQQMEQPKRNELLSQFDVVLHLFPNKEVAQWCKQANIPMRIGTSHRFFHLFTCNFRPSFTRKRSDLHESQLNFKLLAPLGITKVPTLLELSEKLKFTVPDSSNLLVDQDWSNTVLLHPKSNGSGLEYPLAKYMALALALVDKGYQVYFTGTEKEGLQFRQHIPKHPAITDATGQWDLPTFIQLISKAKALVACSTGPYHIAGLCGIQAIGLFAQRKPIHPGRWAALGQNSKALTAAGTCVLCSAGKSCTCIETIDFQNIIDVIEK